VAVCTVNFEAVVLFIVYSITWMLDSRSVIISTLGRRGSAEGTGSALGLAGAAEGVGSGARERTVWREPADLRVAR